MFSMMHIKPPLFLSSDSKSSKTKENSTEFSYGISLDRIRMPPLQKYSRKTHMGSSLSQMPPTQELLMRPSNGRAQSMNLQCSQTGENSLCLGREQGRPSSGGEQGNDQRVKDFASKNDFIGAFRASAKAGININESMEFLIREIIKRMEGMASEGKPEVFTANQQSVVLDTKKHTDES